MRDAKSPEFRRAERATGSSGEIEQLLTDLDRTLRQAQSRSGDGAPNASVDDAVARVRAEVATIIGAAREHADRIVDDARQLAQRLGHGGSAGPGIDALAPVGVGLPADAPSPKPSHSVDLGVVGFANELDPTDEEWLTSLREAVIDERPLDALGTSPDPTLTPVTEQTDTGPASADGSRRRWRRGRS